MPRTKKAPTRVDGPRLVACSRASDFRGPKQRIVGRFGLGLAGEPVERSDLMLQQPLYRKAPLPLHASALAIGHLCCTCTLTLHSTLSVRTLPYLDRVLTVRPTPRHFCMRQSLHGMKRSAPVEEPRSDCVRKGVFFPMLAGRGPVYAEQQRTSVVAVHGWLYTRCGVKLSSSLMRCAQR